jgi:VanZ family protein
MTTTALRRNLGYAAWIVVAVIVVLSLVPPVARPTTMMPHVVEHAGIFAVDGMAFGVAYLGYQRRLSIFAVAFCAGIELAQMMVSGRHARLSDFVVDAAAACIGIFAGPLLIRMTGRDARM